MRLLRATAAAVSVWLLLAAISALGPSVPGGPTPWFGPAAVRAASPGPSADTSGDTRSAGEGPGLVGAPLLAIGGVLALGLLAALGTIAYVRVTGGGSGARAPSAAGEPMGAGSPEGRS